MTSEKQSISIIYDGEALAAHKMDAISFAKSLQGLGEAIHAANTIINGNSEFEVNIDAQLIAGSFGFNLEIIQHLKNAKDVLKLLGLTVSKAVVGETTVLDVLQKLQGRKIDIIEANNSTDTVKISVDGDEITCSKDVEKIVNSPEIRKAIDTFVRQPLLRNGIDRFIVKPSQDSDQTFADISKNDADYFKSPKVLFETKEDDDEFETTITFISANIENKNGWKAELHQEKITVRMEDEEFTLRLKQEDAPSIFGELFSVKMRKTTKNSGGNLTESYTVLKVGRQFGSQNK
ncbi:hypothetical protein PSI23_21015 [Xenorhabdus sp. XENO-10]|uniref:Phage protein n=1 Tax=Xenorhabdus yunnanensis TaxID=3025878 RepID=A0ABT5LMM6_9GAMM|nr:hypothetical protein [Xenorhabdus yunnanensis]MDC9591691.1 hypothetical protein [Xenorhabdus yunnanensis]